MRTVNYPDANLRALLGAVEQIATSVQQGMKVDVAKRITLLVRKVRDCEDERCPDHHGSHRIRLGHLLDLRSDAQVLVNQVPDELVDWHLNTILNHTDPAWLATLGPKERT